MSHFACSRIDPDQNEIHGREEGKAVIGFYIDTNSALRKLLVSEDTLSELAALEQDAKNFRYRMMADALDYGLRLRRPLNSPTAFLSGR